jgi:hypothetical protein
MSRNNPAHCLDHHPARWLQRDRGRSLLWDRLLRGRRARTRGRYPLDLGLARQAVKDHPRLQLRWERRVEAGEVLSEGRRLHIGGSLFISLGDPASSKHAFD